MNAASIWWGQIGNSLQLLTAVTNVFRDGRSAVLQLPVRLPWRMEFRDSAALRRTALCDNRSMKTIAWREKQEPGDFILRELCSRQARADYYPGQSCAAYIGGREDLELHEQNIWITGIHRREDLMKWAAFLREYEQMSAQLTERAVFLLEYDGPQVPCSGVEMIVCTVEEYDCRVFCLEAGAALKNAELREYQAELALRIGGSDPEFAWELLKTGEELVTDPVRTAMQVASQRLNSEGLRFPAMAEQQVLSAAWKASVVLFFPMLEQWRMEIVSQYRQELQHHLPITNSNGEKVTEPADLEVGALYYISRKSSSPFTQEEKAKIELCREVRNLLAHNKLISREDARQIIQL